MHRLLPLLLILLTVRLSAAGLILARWDAPALDRWMYPFNATPGSRPRGPVFGTLGDDAGVDTLHGQVILAFDTAGQVPPGRPLADYLLRRAVFEITVASSETFVLDPSADPWGSHFPPEDPRYEPDADPGRPVLLFGTGFRGGFTAATFPEDGPFGSTAPGGRSAFAAGFNAAAELVDVSNHLGKTNAAFAPFPTDPFAVGDVPGLAAGGPVPAGARMRFELNVADPRVRRYLMEGLRDGRLWFTLASVHGGIFGGQPQYPDFALRENLVHDAPALALELSVVGADDVDGDGLPDDWERHHFGGLVQAAADDPEGDGAGNAEEFAAGTDPADAASSPRLRLARDPDGLALHWTWTPARRAAPEASRDLETWERLELLPAVSATGAAVLRLPATDGQRMFRLCRE